jgi:translation elongation factor EF-1alpha
MKKAKKKAKKAKVHLHGTIKHGKSTFDTHMVFVDFGKETEKTLKKKLRKALKGDK